MELEVKMNNKGFTLIELIATILLIVLSSTVVVINLSGSTSKQEQSIDKKNDNQITEVACNAVDSISLYSIAGFTRSQCMAKSAGQCRITLTQLIKSGLIDAYTVYDDTGINIQTRLNTDSSYVEIRWDSSDGYLVKKCEFHKVLDTHQ